MPCMAMGPVIGPINFINLRESSCTAKSLAVDSSGCSHRRRESAKPSFSYLNDVESIVMCQSRNGARLRSARGRCAIVNAAGGVRGLVIRSLEALEKISLRANLTVASFTFAGPQLTTSQARHMEMLWRTRVDGGELSDFYLM